MSPPNSTASFFKLTAAFFRWSASPFAPFVILQKYFVSLPKSQPPQGSLPKGSESFLNGRRYDAIVDFIHMPEEVKDKHCGVTWAGNTGLQLARLMGNPAAFGEAFTLGTDEGLTWGDVAKFYEEFAGAKFEWVPVEDYLAIATENKFMDRQMIFTDRNLDRRVDFSKVLKATGLKEGDFKSCRDAVAYELGVLSERPDLVKRFDTPLRRELDAKMDAYFGERGGV